MATYDEQHPPGRRWIVERRPDVFEDVGARYVVMKSGCLEFRDNAMGPPVYLLAAGQWLTVVPDEG